MNKEVIMVGKKINRLFRNDFFRSVLKVGSGNLIGQSIGIVTTPILSRIYSDTAYGDRLIIVSTAAIIITLSTLGLNSAIMQPKEDEESKKVFTTALFMNIAVSTAVAMVCMAFQKHFHLITVSGSYNVALLLTWLYMIVYTAQSLVLIYTNRKGRYNKLFFNPIIGAAANIMLAIPFGLAGFGYEGFLITTIVSQFIQVLHMTWRDNPIYRKYRWKDFVSVIRSYKNYILFQYPSNFISNFGNEYPTQFLGRSFSADALGNYSMCLNLMKYPLRLIASPISTVYFKTATEYHRQGKNLAGFTFKMVSRILLFSFLPVAVCCVFSERIFSFVLGAGWAMAGTIASIKAAEYVMLFCVDCVSYCRVSIGRQKTNLAYAITKLVTIMLFSTAGLYLFRSLMGTIVMITVGNTFLHILDMGINFYYLDKRVLWRYLLLAMGYVTLLSGVITYKVLQMGLL